MDAKYYLPKQKQPNNHYVTVTPYTKSNSAMPIKLRPQRQYKTHVTVANIAANEHIAKIRARHSRFRNGKKALSSNVAGLLATNNLVAHNNSTSIPKHMRRTTTLNYMKKLHQRGYANNNSKLLAARTATNLRELLNNKHANGSQKKERLNNATKRAIINRLTVHSQQQRPKTINKNSRLSYSNNNRHKLRRALLRKYVTSSPSENNNVY